MVDRVASRRGMAESYASLLMVLQRTDRYDRNRKTRQRRFIGLERLYRVQHSRCRPAPIAPVATCGEDK